MTFCYFSCLSRYCLQHLSMAALRLLTLDSLPQSDQTVSQLIADTNSLKNIAKAGLYTWTKGFITSITMWDLCTIDWPKEDAANFESQNFEGP